MLIYKKRKKPKQYIFTMQQWQVYLKTKQIKGSDIFNILDVIFWEIYSEDCKLWASSNDSKNSECNFFWSG